MPDPRDCPRSCMDFRRRPAPSCCSSCSASVTSGAEADASIAGQGCSAGSSGPATWGHCHCADSVRAASLLRADMIFGNHRPGRRDPRRRKNPPQAEIGPPAPPDGLCSREACTMRQTVTGRRFGSNASVSPSAPWGALDAGNCSTVARWPSHSRVNRTTCPLGNSSASWCS